MAKAQLVLEDGSSFSAETFGATRSTAGEVVFNTGMVGYPEAMTDPSYRGQILVLTYPLIGNYGIPLNGSRGQNPSRSEVPPHFESDAIQVSGIVVSRLSASYSHWSALESLSAWMKQHDVTGLTGVDSRALTKRLRTQGCMLGKIVVENADLEWEDPNARNLVEEVSSDGLQYFPSTGEKNIILVDLGCKNNIIRRLTARGLNVLRVPWNYDWSREEADGIVLSNGPGDPKMCLEAIAMIKKGLSRNIPILGICLGHQLLSLAAGADTFKLKYGHRSQNQPCIEVGTKRCFITSQNHGYAVNEETLPPEWKPWFFNANDGTNEGMRHRERPIFSVQFHPEASPGPVDTDFIFTTFLNAIANGK